VDRTHMNITNACNRQHPLPFLYQPNTDRQHDTEMRRHQKLCADDGATQQAPSSKPYAQGQPAWANRLGRNGSVAAMLRRSRWGCVGLRFTWSDPTLTDQHRKPAAGR
jgi:hypothetical protein